MANEQNDPKPEPEPELEISQIFLEAAAKQKACEEALKKIAEVLQGLGEGYKAPGKPSQGRILNQWDRDRLDYFQKHGLPLFFEQLKFRGLGLQIFLATEALLFNAWAQQKHSLIALFGLVTCIGFGFWDKRIRGLMKMVHTWGREMADPYFFDCDGEGKAKDGIHVQLDKVGPRWVSQRGVIKLLTWTAAGIWALILFNHIRWWILYGGGWPF